MNTIQKILNFMKLNDKLKSYDPTSNESIQKYVDLFRKELFKIEEQTLYKKRLQSSQFIELNIKNLQKEFDALEILIILCIEFGENFNNSYGEKAIQEQDMVFETIVRHHARACHTAQDILVLLKAGYADAAHSRWRTLHEINATAQFIHKHGQECAERFYKYSVIEKYKSAKQYYEYKDRLSGRAPTNEELKNLTNSRKEFIEMYGNSFVNPYGWACPFIHNENRCNTGSKVNFADIEKDVDLDHIRPYYKWASYNTHASPEGLSPTLGLCETKENILLVGQSNSGLGLPMHSMAMSLVQITSIFLLMEKAEPLFIMKTFSDIKNDIGDMVENKNI